MESRINILNEIREISPVVAQVGNQPTYQVPAGYFDGLAEQVLQRIRAEEENTPVLPNTTNPYQVPQGYFEGLAAQVMQRIKASEESFPFLPQATNPYKVPGGYFEELPNQVLQRIKAEAETTSVLPKTSNPYQAPAAYFEQLPEQIMSRIKAEEAGDAHEELEMLSPLLSRIGKNTPFSMPAGYFEELSDNAVAGAQAIDFVNGELENLSPLMNSLRHQQVYEVPADYFEQFPAQVLAAAKAQRPTRVVSMTFRRRVLQFAAAAVVAGFIGIAGWMFLGNNHGKAITPANDNNPNPEIASVQLDSVSDDVLQNYLENQNANTPVETTVAANNEIEAKDMKEMLADVSDDDLQQYIEKYNTSKDIETNQF